MALNFFTLSAESMILGLAIGLLCALTTKYTTFSDINAKVEVTIMMVFAYASYLCGEACHFSGIITMFTCGLAMSHYAYRNITP